MIGIDTNGLRWFDTSPDAGDPTCTCSHCDKPIADEVPLRLWNAAGQEARLHVRCFALRTGAPPATEFAPMADEEDSGGVCAICGREGKLFVDHNHETGEIRGLLCLLCNTAIGKLRDDPGMLLRAVMYLVDNGEPVPLEKLFSEHGALVRVLIAKGYFTEEEYFEELVKGVEAEQAAYEARLSARYGGKTKIKLV